jgi:hypothetical protein
MFLDGLHLGRTFALGRQQENQTAKQKRRAADDQRNTQRVHLKGLKSSILAWRVDVASYAGDIAFEELTAKAAKSRRRVEKIGDGLARRARYAAREQCEGWL